jgi:hyperosmotically inducible protein
MKTIKNRMATLAVSAIMLTSLVQAGPGPTPDTLNNKVRHQLVMLPYLNVFDDLSFRVDGGTVTLFGEVTRPVLKSDAENVVKRVEGVTQVNNQIEVLPLSPMDSQIRLRTYRAVFGGPLQRYSMGTLPSIRIIVKNGNVTLTGLVSSNMDKQLAYMRANSVPGVFSVTNQLQVEK